LTGPERRQVLELLAVNVQVIDQEHFQVTALFPISGDEISLPRPARARTTKAAGGSAPEVGTGRFVNTSVK
jgi:hypothetical protein